jgi:peptidyl-prolyl cis-trans isomerase A (cyclophilin A)
MGDIVLELNPGAAPKTVANFLQYVNDKHYDGTIFHRVIDGFMIQGGGFTADMQQSHARAHPAGSQQRPEERPYTIAMARTGNPNSATAQFFINVVNNDMLNAPKPDGHGYAVFGKVVEGMEWWTKSARWLRAPWHAPECAHHAGHHHLGHRAR